MTRARRVRFGSRIASPNRPFLTFTLRTSGVFAFVLIVSVTLAAFVAVPLTRSVRVFRVNVELVTRADGALKLRSGGVGAISCSSCWPVAGGAVVVAIVSEAGCCCGGEASSSPTVSVQTPWVHADGDDHALVLPSASVARARKRYELCA